MNSKEASALSIVVQDIHVSFSIGPGSAAGIYTEPMLPSAVPVDADLDRIIDAIRSGREFQVRAYNRKNSSVLTVTKLGP